MKTLNHYKSFGIASISGAINNDVNEVCEARYQREIKLTLYGDDKLADLTVTQHSSCRLSAYSYTLGQVQALLTIAVMELKHLETVNTQHAPIPSK